MIGNLFSFLFEAGVEHAAVQAVINFAKAVWSGQGQETVTNWVMKKFEPKGLDDENAFAYIISVAPYVDGDISKGPMPGVTPDKLKLIRKTYAEMSEEDKRNKTRYASNARLIIIMDGVNRGVATIEKKDNGKTVEVRTEPHESPNKGTSIIQDMALSCRAKKDVRDYLMALGAFQDAPFGTLDELRHWAKTVGWPKLERKLNQMHIVTRRTARFVENHYIAVENEWNRAVAMPWTNPITKLWALFRAM